MNTKSYKGRKPLRIAAALILALAMMVTAMPMTVIAQTITTASQAAETNEAPAQAIEAEKAPLAENAAFEEKAEAEENSYEAAAPEAQQETSEAIKTETTVAETSSETRKAKEKALPEKSGDYPYERTTGSEGDQVGANDAYVYLRYFMVDNERGDLFEVTGYNAKYYRTGAERTDANLVNVWDHSYYDCYHGEKINLTTISGHTLDIANKMIATSIENSSNMDGVGIALNYKALEGSEDEFYHRYSVCFAIGPSEKSNVNLFDDTYERTDFMQFRKIGYYGPLEGGPYIRPAASSGNEEVQWSFSGEDGDFRTYGVAEDNNVPAVYVIFKRADINHSNDTKLIIDHKALQDADDIELNDIDVFNGNGKRTINDCEVTVKVGFDQLEPLSLTSYTTSGNLEISEGQLMSAVANKYGEDPSKYNPAFNNDESEYKFRVKLAVANDTLGDVYVQTAKAVNDAHYSYYSKYSQVTSNIDTTPTDINSINWVDAGNGWFETDLINIYRLLDAANDGDFDNTITSADNVITETLYSNAASENLTITYKYYDRDRSGENGNKPADVSPVETVVNKTAVISNGSESNENKVKTMIAGSYPQNVCNALDKLVFNTSQEGYIDYLTTPSYMPLNMLFGSHDYTYYSNYYNSSENIYHTDCYGRCSNDNDYMSEYEEKTNKEAALEKWVSYYDSANIEIPVEDVYSTGFDLHRISKIVVWGYNTPQKFMVTYSIPNSANDNLTPIYSNQTGNSEQVWIVESAANRVPIQRLYYYNQRIGEAFVKPDETSSTTGDPRNGVTEHLEKWGLSYAGYDPSGTASAEVIAPDTVPGNNDLVFDGWYVNNGTDGKPYYVKVSSDKEYTGRVMETTALFAGYKHASEQQQTDCGFTLTSLAPEHYYSEDGQERVVLTTVLNAYGYPAGEDSANTLNGKKIAIVYAPTLQGTSYTVPNADDMLSLLVDESNMEAYINSAMTSEQNPDGVLVKISGAQLKGYCYTYTIRTTDPNSNGETGSSEETGNVLKLTNQNRAQFNIDLPEYMVKYADDDGNTGVYAEMIVFTAFNSNSDIITINDDLVFSDNYLYYSNISEKYVA